MEVIGRLQVTSLQVLTMVRAGNPTNPRTLMLRVLTVATLLTGHGQGYYCPVYVMVVAVVPRLGCDSGWIGL